jgi:hypothetical protein
MEFVCAFRKTADLVGGAFHRIGIKVDYFRRTSAAA